MGCLYPLEQGNHKKNVEEKKMIKRESRTTYLEPTTIID